MKKHLLPFLLLFAVMFTGKLLHGQDPHFSQFYNTPLAVNPASAGAIHEMEGYLNHRKQWASVTVPFTSFMASFSGQITAPKRGRKGHWAGGAYAFNDVGGDGSLRTNALMASATYHIRLSRDERLGMGIQSGFASRSLDFSKFQWGSQYQNPAYNAALPSGEGQFADAARYIDLGMGVHYTYNNNSGYMKVTGNHYKRITGGVSFQHLNRPRFSFLGNQDRLYVKMIVHGSALWSLEATQFALQPVFNFSKQGPHNEFVFGSNARYEIVRDSKYTALAGGSGLYAGVLYRSGDAVIFTAALEMANYYFGVSYDLNASQLTPASGGRGGMEFCLRITERVSKRSVNTTRL